MSLLILVTGPPASGKTALARPLARHLGLPLLAKDTVKEALFDTLGTGDRAWSRRLGGASIAVLLALATELDTVILDVNFYPAHAPDIRAVCKRPIEVFCRCPPSEVHRRFLDRAPTRHPGHVDHAPDQQLTDALTRGITPLDLGGPVLEVDTSLPVNIPAVGAWVTRQVGWQAPTSQGAPGQSLPAP